MNQSRSIVREWILAAATLTAATAPLSAGRIHLKWDPVPQAAGYRIYYGTEPHHYTNVIDVGTTIEHVVTDLADCRDYFVAVKAYNGAGESADFSNEVQGWPQPEVDEAPAPILKQGSQVTLDITGRNFQTAAQLVVDRAALPTDMDGNPLIRLESVTVVSCREVQALVTIEPTARGFRAMQIGSFPLQFEIFNPDSVYGTGPIGVNVDLNQERLDINRSDSDTRDRVDGKDLVWLAFAHGALEGEPRYSPDADLNGDGAVDGEDLAYLAQAFGGCWTGTGWSRSRCTELDSPGGPN
jgi:fibronectin type III domain protein